MADIKELAQNYVDSKAKLDPLKKSTDAINKSLKEAMTTASIDEIELDTMIVKRIVKVIEDFDEDKLIKTIEHMTYNTPDCKGPIAVGSGLGVIKMKPYVDMDALEDAIYKGFITEENMLKIAECKTKTERVELRISKKKKETD